MTNRKKNQPVTFELLTEFYAEFIKPQFDKLNKKADRGFVEAEKIIERFS